jgi:hypothetical protein
MAKSVKALFNPIMLAWARGQAGYNPVARKRGIDEPRLHRTIARSSQEKPFRSGTKVPPSSYGKMGGFHGQPNNALQEMRKANGPGYHDCWPYRPAMHQL